MAPWDQVNIRVAMYDYHSCQKPGINCPLNIWNDSLYSLQLNVALLGVGNSYIFNTAWQSAGCTPLGAKDRKLATMNQLYCQWPL